MTPKKVQKSMNFLLKQLSHIKVTLINYPSGDSPHIDRTQSGWNPVHNKHIISYSYLELLLKVMGSWTVGNNCMIFTDSCHVQLGPQRSGFSICIGLTVETLLLSCSFCVEQQNRREGERSILWGEMHLVSFAVCKLDHSYKSLKFHIHGSSYRSPFQNTLFVLTLLWSGETQWGNLVHRLDITGYSSCLLPWSLWPFLCWVFSLLTLCLVDTLLHTRKVKFLEQLHIIISHCLLNMLPYKDQRFVI